MEREGVRVSMEGKGRDSGNIFVERLWRTVKYEEVYTGGSQAKTRLEVYFHLYNNQRPHQALGYRTPAEVFNGESVESDEQPRERRWAPRGALADLGNPAGLSLNIVPNLSN